MNFILNFKIFINIFFLKSFQICATMRCEQGGEKQPPDL